MSREPPTSGTPAALTALSDDLNAALCDAEDAIEGLKLGVTGRVPIDLGPNSSYSALEWSKSNNIWGLYLISEGAKTEKLWVNNAGRPARIAVAHALPDLLTALRANVGEQSIKVREAVDYVRAFIASIRESTMSRFAPGTLADVFDREGAARFVGMKNHANMTDQEFAKASAEELESELKNAHEAIDTALSRAAQDLDLDEVKRACDWALAASAAVSRRHPRPFRRQTKKS